MRYIRACRNYADILYRIRLLLTIRLLNQGYDATRLKSSLQKFCGRPHELVDCYGISICFVRRVIVCFSSFFLPGTDLFISASAGASSQAEDTYTTGALSPCSHFLLESELLIYFCFFVRIILIILCSLLCMSFFPVFALSVCRIRSFNFR